MINGIILNRVTLKKLILISRSMLKPLHVTSWGRNGPPGPLRVILKGFVTNDQEYVQSQRIEL